MTKKFILPVTAAVMTMALVCGCAGRGNEKEFNVLSFEQAKEVEPSLMSTTEIISLIKSDTTHKKVVYWFDILCQPCRHYLSHEIAEFYANHDTAEWRIYLVAGLNGLRLGVPDKDGGLVENTAEEIRYFSGEYREHLPQLGFDMKDVYIHYDPELEDPDYREKYPDGFFTYFANEIFHSDVTFRCDHDGIPKLFKADRNNTLLTDYNIEINKDNDTLNQYYYPDDQYLFDVTDFQRHDTILSVIM